MIKQSLTFSAIQISALLLSFFIFAFALAGSHGRLYFFSDGWKIIMIITLILIAPLIYLFTQRRNLQHKKPLFFIAALFLCLGVTTVCLGLPNMTNQFIINKDGINNISIYDDRDLTIDVKLQPEMFERVSIEADITKANAIEFQNLKLTVLNSKNEIVKPVFRPLAWNSSHSEPIQMDSFFEVTDYSKMNKFYLSAQYPINGTDSLKIQMTYSFTKNGQTIINNKDFRVRIASHLIFEKFIEY